LHRRFVLATGSDLRSGLHLDLVTAAKKWMNGDDPGNVHDMPAMNPQESAGVELAFHRTKRFIQEMSPGAAMELDIVVLADSIHSMESTGTNS